MSYSSCPLIKSTDFSLRKICPAKHLSVSPLLVVFVDPCVDVLDLSQIVDC